MNTIPSSLPAVTVSVLSYNSANFIIETLDSIYNQSYPHLILQVCDDCSTDDTLTLCQKWIDTHGSRFVKTKIIQPESNTGVTANCNRAWEHCETDYCKDIAGDDILLPNCIEDNMKYASAHPEALIIFSRLEVLPCRSDASKVEREAYEAYAKSYRYSFFTLSDEEQATLLEKSNRLYAPTAFYKVKELLAMGLRHDERIPDIEDYPKWLNALHMGIKFHFFDIATVGYRYHNASMSNGQIYSERNMRSLRLIEKYYGKSTESKEAHDTQQLMARLGRLQEKQHKHLRIIRLLIGLSALLFVLLLFSFIYR